MSLLMADDHEPGDL